MCFLVVSSKFKSVSIDRKDSDDVPSIPRALMERLTNLTVEYDLWRLVMRGWYFAALQSLFIFILDYDYDYAKSQEQPHLYLKINITFTLLGKFSFLSKTHVSNSGPRAKFGWKCNNDWPARSY